MKKGGLTKAFENLAKFADGDHQKELAGIIASIDDDRIREIVDGVMVQKSPKENCGLAVSCEGRFFNEG